MKTLIKQVENVLLRHPQTRNSDIDLMITIWEEYYSELIDEEGKIKLHSLFELPREDHIKRIRTKIQNEERRFLPTDLGILIERAKLSDEWKRFLGYQTYWTDSDWSKILSLYLEKPEQTKLI